MRAKKVLFVGLSLFVIASCSQQKESDNPVISNKTTESSSSNEDVESSLLSSNLDSSSKEESDSSSSFDPYKTNWKTEIVTLMLKYLNGNVIPYYNLGSNRKITAEWIVTQYDYGKLHITGNQEFTSSTLNELRDTYKDYMEDDFRESYIAFSSKDKKLHFEFSKDSEDNYIILDCYYDEEYSLSSSTSYEDTLKDEIVDLYGEEIPFIYLGVKYPSLYVHDQKIDKFVSELYGGKWNSSILTDAKKTLEDNHAIVKITDDNLSATYTSTKTGNKFSIDIYPLITREEVYGGRKKKIVMKIKMEESYNPNVLSSWPSSITYDMDYYLDGHVLPYIYLGTSAPSSYYRVMYDRLEITGNLYQANMLDDAKNKFDQQNDSWTTKVENDIFTASKTFDDSCVLSVELKYDTNEKAPILSISIQRSYHIPTTKTDWTNLTKKDMTTYFNEVFPYIYLNTSDDYSVYYEDTKTLQIDGGFFIKDILSSAKETYEVLKADDDSKLYTITQKEESIEMKKNDDSILITIKKDSTTNLVILTIQKLN